MRVSVVNFCSTAVDMLRFSTEMLLEHAGTEDFDYIVVTWNPTLCVESYCRTHPQIIPIVYKTDDTLDYVPNLRAMMNHGFDMGFELNEYVAIVNTDMAFGRDWLKNLMKHASEDVIPNSLHIAPIEGPNIITENCGVPTKRTFDTDKFWKLHDTLFEDRIEKDSERGGWEATNTLPYVIHQKWWEQFGPWNPEVGKHKLPPDRRFFGRVAGGGAQYILVHDSVCYHHEAVERRNMRPVGIEDMPEGR